MTNLIKSSEIKELSLSQIRATDINSKTDVLLEALGATIGKNIKKTSSLESIRHGYELKATITSKTAKVKIEREEVPGSSLVRRNDPIELKYFSYEDLKSQAEQNGNRFRGKLYGSIELHSCPTEIECPDCKASGICHHYGGERQVACSVCDGSKECPSCNGTGRYTCENCHGDGVCPECDDGWIQCQSCYGEGEIDCSDCNGTGNFIDETCNRCGGYGEVSGHTCGVCGGNGRFVRKCRRCSGDGELTCEECNGEGGWDCEECHGTGDCSHCHGRGYHKCKACDGSGKCGKCKGKGKIWCPECHGKGVCFTCKGTAKVTCPRCKGLGEFQSFTEYIFEESEETKIRCSLPIDSLSVNEVTGNICFRGIVYEYFAKQRIVEDTMSPIQSVDNIQEAELERWLAFDNNSPFPKHLVNDDYLKTYAEIGKIPVTQIKLKCNSTTYNVYIVGNNKLVFYDLLPGFKDSLVGRLKKIFGR